MQRTFLLLMLLMAAVTNAQAAQSQPCGKAVRGIELCLANTTTPGHLKLRIHNRGPAVAINLGFSLPSGLTFATSVSMIIVDAAGHSYNTKVKEIGVIAGRIDPIVIPLPRDGSYEMLIALENYGAAGFNFDQAKPYKVHAQLTVQADKNPYAPLWHGVVNSNTLALRTRQLSAH